MVLHNWWLKMQDENRNVKRYKLVCLPTYIRYGLLIYIIVMLLQIATFVPHLFGVPVLAFAVVSPPSRQAFSNKL
jgi:hypothetical protein